MTGQTRGNLPPEFTSFVGRTHEVAEIRALLGSTRVVTLTGPGGVGKTRLAVRVAESLADGFRDGAWFVDLAPVDDEESVPRAFATALRIVEEAGFDRVATLAARLHDRDLLVVIDNCEHLVDEVASLSNELLRSAPGLRLLATSREPLGIAGEAIWDVPPLALPTDDATSALEAVRHDAARLYHERARLADSRFEITDANADAVVRVCRRVDGLPLGIELSAAATRVLTVEEIADRLERQLPLPRTTDRTRDARHRTIEAAIEWSYELLSESEKRLLRRLSVFAGGCSIGALQAVCAEDDTGIDPLQLVADLVDKSLVVKTTGTGGRARYTLLETVRAFAIDRLVSSDEDGDVRDQHVRFFMSFDDLSEYLTDAVSYLDRFDEEHDNFRAALAWAQATDADAALKLAVALGAFWNARGHLDEGREWLERLLRVQTEPSTAAVEGLLYLASIAWRQREADEALRLNEEAVRMARAIDSRYQIALALALLGFSAAVTDDLDLARRASEESFALAEADGDEILLAQAVSFIGVLAVIEERADALAAVDESITRWRKLNAKGELSYALYFMARAALNAGDDNSARRALEESMSVALGLHEMQHVAGCLGLFAALAARAGDPQRSLRLAGASAALQESTGLALDPNFERFAERWIEPARAALGRKVTLPWSEGRAMPLEAAIDYALGGVEAPRDAGTPALTKREMEVARQLTTGLTNRQIAGRLTISERTVDAHVEHIRNKLGLRTRAQIAAWVTEQQAAT